MTTQPTGERVTPKRVAELRAEIAAVKAELMTELRVLRDELQAIRELPADLARAFAQASINSLQRSRDREPPKELDE